MDMWERQFTKTYGRGKEDSLFFYLYLTCRLVPSMLEINHDIIVKCSLVLKTAKFVCKRTSTILAKNVLTILIVS